MIADRALQALAAAALEPEWEARFEPRSYGFRPGRGCHDAIVAIHTTASRRDARRLWALDADLEAAFDRLSHDHILTSLGTFPARGLVRRWLKAGVIEDGRFTPTGEGTPQGGVVSPCLMNVALHGMEEAAGVRYWEGGTLRAVPGTPVLVRYADDVLALCHTREQAEHVKQWLARWLEPRGLAFNEAKTRITHLDQGVDFLGFEIRRYRGKLLTKPSKDALRRIRKRLSQEVTALRGANADAVIARLNPIITGWAAYYRIGVSKRAFGALDAHLWRLVYKWSKFSHPNKPRRWIITRYFGMFNPARQDKWVFGSRETGFYLRKFAWTKIVRHRMVAGRASPDDPALTGYWEQRRRRARLPVDPATWHLLRRQRGRCPLCRGLLLHADRQPQTPEEWQQWHTATRKAIRKHAITSVTSLGTPDERAAYTSYTPAANAVSAKAAQHSCPVPSHQACLSRAARKAGTAVLRGPRAATRRGYPTSGGSPSSPTTSSAGQRTAASPSPRTTSASGSTSGTRTRSHSSGPSPLTTSSRPSPNTANGLPTQDTSCL